MKTWQSRTTKYFYFIAGAVAFSVVLFILVDSFKYRQVKRSLTTYMENLREMIFMSTYDSLKKGNMKLFKSHLEEIGTFGDVREFSLLDKEGTVRYSSNPQLVKQVDSGVIGLGQVRDLVSDGFTTYYFPVETLSYCTRCHPDWKVESINSYYKLTLSRKALDTVKTTTFYSHSFTVAGGGLFLAFCYLLLTLYERKKHEEQLHLSAGVFENAVEAIAITDFEGRIEKINPAFTRITGFAAEEILGRDIHILDAGEINRVVYAEMRAGLSANGLWSGEMWNRRNNGEIFPVRISVTAIRNIHNRISHFVSILYDITSLKAAESAMVEMDKMKSEFISSAAHELRTPLSAIMGFTEFVREPEMFGGFTPEQIKEFLDEIYDRGEALNQIIDDLLDISRIENGYSIELKFEDVYLPEVVVKSMSYHMAHNATHSFRLDLPESSEEPFCRIDRYRINQVLENLLSNAIKYSPPGSEVLLKCRLAPTHWEISVIDHGIGMTPEQRARIFDKFYRADASNTAVSGLGLGMSIARKIIELHHGRIWVESVMGEGTTVIFTLERTPGSVTLEV